MSLRVNTNVESLTAHRHILNNDKMLSKSIERLSSGQKINRGADGPAALVISEGMRSQIASLQQAADNNESAISMVQTAEGALNEVSKLLVDMRNEQLLLQTLGSTTVIWLMHLRKRLRMPWMPLIEFLRILSLVVSIC